MGCHAPARLVQWRCVGAGPATRSKDQDGVGGGANLAVRGGAGARLLLLFAHSFAEGEAERGGGGLGLDTPCPPSVTPRAMGAGEKNGTQTGEERARGAGKGPWGASPWSHPSAGDAPPSAAPGVGSRRTWGWGVVRGAHSEVAGGKSKVLLLRDPGSACPLPLRRTGVFTEALQFGVGGRSPRVRLLPRKSTSAPWTLTMACEPRFVLRFGGEGLDGHGFWERGCLQGDSRG